MYIRKPKVDGRLSALPDGPVHSSPGEFLPIACVTEDVTYSWFPFLSQVGPHAVNLAGGQAASMRISRDITQRLRPDNEEAAQRTGKAKTEEYIQQMKGLMWL